MILQHIAARLQEFYRLDTLPPLAPFLVDTATAAALVGDHHFAAHAPEELLLVGQRNADLEVALYIAPHVLDRLHRDDPLTALHRENLAAFCTAIEGMSHLCCLLWKFQHGMPVTQLELEIQAEIDKYLFCAWLQAEQATPRLPLHHRLFVHYSVADDLPVATAKRYHRASAIAHRFCRFLHARYIAPSRFGAMHRMLKEFYRLSHWQKMCCIA